MTDPGSGETDRGDRFAYFMVRVRVDALNRTAGFGGVLERLGTTWKQAFPDGQELLRLIAEWSKPQPNMMPDDPARNELEAPGLPGDRGGV